MKLNFNQSLKRYNTFGVEATAKIFAEIAHPEDVIRIISDYPDESRLFLGGGSNILFTKDFDGVVLYNQMRGKKILTENEDEVLVEVDGGENWHQFVEYTLENGWGGVENLSLIPGTVGAAPIQNIGAYGVELKDVVHSVIALDLLTLKVYDFSNEACEFAYRDSIFKRTSGKYFILSVIFRLTKRNHTIRTSYGDIAKILEKKSIKHPTPKDVSEAVIEIRSSKLPDPSKIGNAGSFFKNPVLSVSEFETLISKHSFVKYFKQNDGVKIPAAWLIEQCGWKGYEDASGAAVHHLQPLVLINKGKASGMDIWNLSERILQSVYEKFGVKLQREVNIL